MDTGPNLHPDPHVLREFAAGRLPPERAAAVERHLLGCEACGRALEAAPGDDFLRRFRAAQG